MKRVLVLIAILAAAATDRQVSGQTDVGEWMIYGEVADRYGCLPSPPGPIYIRIVVRVTSPGVFEVPQGSVDFFRLRPYPKTEPPQCTPSGDLIPWGIRDFRLTTDRNPPNVPKVESFKPRGTPPTLTVTSRGQCGPTANQQGLIRATITPDNVTLECGGYRASGRIQPKVKFQELLSCTNPTKAAYERKYEDPWMTVDVTNTPTVFAVTMGARCRNAHFIQFVKRDGPSKTYYPTVGGRKLEYGRWNVDIYREGSSPYYDEYGKATARNACLWMQDTPSTDPNSPAAHFVTFAICDDVPVRRFEWTVTRDNMAQMEPPRPTSVDDLCAFYTANNVPATQPRFSRCIPTKK